MIIPRTIDGKEMYVAIYDKCDYELPAEDTEHLAQLAT